MRSLIALLLSAFAACAAAQPSLKMMIPANPGGGWDQTGRNLAAAMQSGKLVSGVQFENKGGAAGTIGLAQFVNSAKGDPNAVMIGGMVMVGGIHLGKSPVNLSQVTPIARLTSEWEVIVVPAASPIKTPDAPGKEAPAIIICHGLGANRSHFTDLAVLLSLRGYWVLTFDFFRAHGDSGGSRSSLGLPEQKDVAAALAFLSARPGIDRERIGIFGFSLGGSTAILAAARSGKFAAVAADSAFTSLRDQALEAITGFYHLPAFPFVNLSVLVYELYFQASVKNVAPESVIGSISPVPLFIIAGEG